MAWPLLLLGFAAGVAVVSSGETKSSNSGRREPSRLPPTWKRVPCERRVFEEEVVHDDDGTPYSAMQFTPCDWDPVPWKLWAWTNEAENAEVFRFVSAPETSPGTVRTRVFWSDEKFRSEKDFRTTAEPVSSDPRFHNRLIWRYGGSAGAFLIEIDCCGDRLSFFHKPKGRAVASVAVPIPAVPPNPFAARLERIIRIEEQYREARERAQLRRLPPDIEKAVLDDLEEQFQDEVLRLNGGGDGEA